MAGHNDLLELLQCLIDAQTLLECSNRNNDITEDLLAARRRQVIRMWRSRLGVEGNFPVYKGRLQ
jgi:hypothetical protein